MADPFKGHDRIYPEQSKSETFSPNRPHGKKKKRETFQQLKLPLAKYGGKTKFINDPTTGPNA